MDNTSHACKDFQRTTGLKKTNVFGQGIEKMPTITINDYRLDAVHQCIYLDSTETDSLSLDTESTKRIYRAAATFTKN